MDSVRHEWQWRRAGRMLLAAILCGGCDRTESPLKSPPLPPSAAAPDEPAAASPATDQPPADIRSPALQPSANGAAPATVPASSGVELSAGVALAQTLPEGTTMGFSVDYEFVQGGPAAGARYLLLIQAATGEPAEIEFQPEASGTWQGFVKGLWPEQAPFQAQVVEVAADGSRRAISAVEPLR